MLKLNIGPDFSYDPVGRFYSDGDSSGEAFRQDKLLPLLSNLEQGVKLEIVIDDGIEAYGSSFLAEGFAGLVKYGYFSSDEVLNMIIISYTDDDFSFFEKKIYQYIKEATFHSKIYVPTKKIK